MSPGPDRARARPARRAPARGRSASRARGRAASAARPCAASRAAGGRRCRSPRRARARARPRAAPAGRRLERPGRPLLERVLLDDEPDLLAAALDLLLRADQPRHVRIASSIFGYVPQRHRFPAMRCLISSRAGLGRRLDERDGARRSGRACRSRTAPRRRGRTRRPSRGRAGPRSSSPRRRDAVGERDARERRRAVDEHRARAAVPLVAGDLRPGQPEALAQRLGQRRADRRVELVARRR